MIRLETINENNYRAVINIKLPPEQDLFVAPNVTSLAQAYVYRDLACPYAILNDDTVVGFIMLDWDESERTVGIWRLMIAPNEQNKGYGRQTLEIVIKMAKDNGNIDLLFLDYVPGNDIGRNLYYSLGFRENGKEDCGEIIMTMKITDSPKLGIVAADEDDIDEICEQLTTLNREQVVTDINANKIRKLTIYGDVVGIVKDGCITLCQDQQQYLVYAQALITG